MTTLLQLYEIIQQSSMKRKINFDTVEKYNQRILSRKRRSMKSLKDVKKYQIGIQKAMKAVAYNPTVKQGYKTPEVKKFIPYKPHE